MFTELMPLLKQRILVLTISRVDDELICVTVIPKKRDDGADENTALTIPLALTGKPDELDRNLNHLSEVQSPKESGVYYA